jgi:hypothetical protein
LEKLTTLSIVSGTATYDLPDDFLRVISLESLWSPDNVLVSDSGLVPVSATYEERHYVVNGGITFDPTPTYTTSRDLWYAAGYVLDSREEYDELDEEGAEIVMLKARAIALGMQASAMASDILSYQVGDVRIRDIDARDFDSSSLAVRDQLDLLCRWSPARGDRIVSVGVGNVRAGNQTDVTLRRRCYHRHRHQSFDAVTRIAHLKGSQPGAVAATFKTDRGTYHVGGASSLLNRTIPVGRDDFQRCEVARRKQLAPNGKISSSRLSGDARFEFDLGRFDPNIRTHIRRD